MKLYHLDRHSSIRPNQNIDLTPLSSLPGDKASSPFLSYFSQGISCHGLNQLSEGCPYIKMGLSANGEPLLYPQSFADSKAFVDAQIMEIVFELVRRSHFPHLPSRFTSLFAVGSLDEFLLWPELSNIERFPHQQIIEINAPDDTPCFDSSFLRGGLIFGQQGNQYYMGYLPVASVDLAFNYWSGRVSEHPRMEYLASLPIVKEQHLVVNWSPQGPGFL